MTPNDAYFPQTYEPLFIVGHPIIINVLILRRWLNILKTPFARVVSNIVPRFMYNMRSLLNKFKPSKTTHNYLRTYYKHKHNTHTALDIIMVKRYKEHTNNTINHILLTATGI